MDKNTIKNKLNKPCDYCGGNAYYRFNTGKKSYCCKDNISKCPAIKSINSKKAQERKRSLHSEKTKEKIRLANIGKKRSEETKAKLRRPKTEEHKMKLSLARIGIEPWNKGKTGVYSQKTLNNISKSLKGNIPWNKGVSRPQSTRNKISKTRKKRIKSGEIVMLEETKHKISKANKGKKRSIETRLKMSIAASGENSSQWKGGVSCEPYCDIWRDKEYKEDILKRDNYQCQNPDCWKTSNKICRHHIDYDKKNCSPLNIITLCFSCNSRANSNRDYWMSVYQNIIIQKYGNEDLKIAV